MPAGWYELAVCNPPVVVVSLPVHILQMSIVQPSAYLLRTRAIALLAISLVTMAMFIEDLIGPSRLPMAMVLPVVVTYFLFNFGFIFIIKQGGLTKGTRLGAGAVVLNFCAMFLRDFELAWRTATAAAVLVSLAAAYMLSR